MSMSQETSDVLRRGLVGERIALYQSNAAFHSGIETLVTLLPLMVNGLAANAEDWNDQAQREIERLMRSAPLLSRNQDQVGEPG